MPVEAWKYPDEYPDQDTLVTCPKRTVTIDGDLIIIHKIYIFSIEIFSGLMMIFISEIILILNLSDLRSKWPKVFSYNTFLTKQI